MPLNNCSFGLTRAQYEAGEQALPDCADYGFWPAVETFAQTVNIDEAVTKGIEASMRWEAVEGVTLSANYTLTKSEVKSGADAGLPLYDTPRHMVNGAIRWAATDALNLWMRGEYRSSRFRPEDSALSRAKATWGDYRAYTLFHLGGNFRVDDHFRIGLTVYNLFNKDFVTYAPYVSNVNTGAIAYTNLYANNQEPRRIWLNVNVDF